jgi:hypothetical protein
VHCAWNLLMRSAYAKTSPAIAAGMARALRDVIVGQSDNSTAPDGSA